MAGLTNIPLTIGFVYPDRAPKEISFCEQVACKYINQQKLPEELEIKKATSKNELIDAIASLEIRGAPAIGVAGAMAILLSAAEALDGKASLSKEDLLICVQKDAEQIVATRPTAINLKHACHTMIDALEKHALVKDTSAELLSVLKKEVASYIQADIQANELIGLNGSSLIKSPSNFLTHCNAGSLATVHGGTALSVIYKAFESGNVKHVYADETRPVLQGARLTMWELTKAEIPCTLQVDGASAYQMSQGNIDIVIVGADRIAANGDSANKIGTLGLAILANYFKIPFYVAAPVSTIDITCASGADIPIEERSKAEVFNSSFYQNAKIANPAFDVTPHTLIDAIITDKGIVYPKKLSIEEIKTTLNSFLK